jgi:hypothetical protein
MAEQYPKQIAVFCDECGTDEVHDYMVSEDDDQETRLGYARKYLAEEKGWLIQDNLDLCPECSFC